MLSEIRVLRDISGLTQKQFAYKYCIPVGTLRNWEQGISSPPNSQLFLLYKCVMLDKRKGL